MNKHLLVCVKEAVISVPQKDVVALEPLHGVFSSPMLPKGVRGFLYYQGEMVMLAGLREWLNLPPMEEEKARMLEMMRNRKADHVYWLDTLLKSVDENAAFKLATDPHQCVFGMWYDHFKTDDPDLKILLEEFEAPHCEIHELAGKIERLMKADNVETARSMIEYARKTTLKKMIQLFDDFDEKVQAGMKETAILFSEGGKKAGIVADRVLPEKIEIEPEQLEIWDIFNSEETYNSIKNSNRPVPIVLDISALLKGISKF